MRRLRHAAFLFALLLPMPALAQPPEFARPAAVSRANLVAAPPTGERPAPLRFAQSTDSTDHSVLGAFIGVVLGGTAGALLGSKVKTDDCRPSSCDSVDQTEGMGVAMMGIFGAIFGGIAGGTIGWWIGKRS